MKVQPFDRSKHVYRNNEFVELVKDAVRFFNGSPIHSLPPPVKFLGTGVYALYYIGNHSLYNKYGELNRLSYNHPIYVGKAVPKGWRQARVTDNPLEQSKELYGRLNQHSRNIAATSDLKIDDFSCRFVIFEDAGSVMIGTIEASLIQYHRPLWNMALDGFGNHDPGKGRYEQAKSDWDIIHPGRAWARKCNGRTTDENKILRSIKHHLDSISGKEL